MTLFKTGGRPGGRLAHLNPYRVGAKLIWDRLTWDLRPAAWSSRSKLRSLLNTHVGEKAIILCNGPSLRDIDFSKLKNVFTFGLNKINLLFGQTSFRPSAIVAVNPFVLEQNVDFYSHTDIPLFLDRAAIPLGTPHQRNICFLHSCDFPYFARDCSTSIFQGYTVTYVALQLAYHMGFNSVALVGCDHDYQADGTPNTVEIASEKDSSHFCENYFSNQPWHLPDLTGSELYYDMARRCYAHDGKLVVNASTKTKLDIFPRMTLDQFLML